MMQRMAEGARRIFLACGATDFHKQIPGLISAVSMQFKLDPYQDSFVFIFCNRKKDAIKVLSMIKTDLFWQQKKCWTTCGFNGQKNRKFVNSKLCPVLLLSAQWHTIGISDSLLRQLQIRKHSFRESVLLPQALSQKSAHLDFPLIQQKRGIYKFHAKYLPLYLLPV